MSQILFFDSETNGKPVWKIPSNRKEQPHIVQLAAILCDEESREVIETMDVIVKPDGWEITEETVKIHGITQEHALEVGITEIEALQMFLKLWYQCDLRVAHSTTFDNRIIRIALKRYMRDLIKDEVWKDRDLYYCTLQKSKKIMGGKSGHTLAEAYLHFTGKVLEDAHNALADTQACMEIYFAIQDIDDEVPKGEEL
ncbi:MAG: 3'-5' exonuclease [Nitrosomonadaceae bacterium]